MGKIVAWLVLSSQKPNKISLFVKGLLLGVVPTIVYISGLAHLNVDGDQFTVFIDALATVIEIGLGLIAAVSTLVGIVRKIWATITGTNKVVNEGYTLKL